MNVVYLLCCNAFLLKSAILFPAITAEEDNGINTGTQLHTVCSKVPASKIYTPHKTKFGLQITSYWFLSNEFVTLQNDTSLKIKTFSFRSLIRERNSSSFLNKVVNMFE